MSNKIKCFKLNDKYCSSDCCMVMVPVSKSGVIVGREGILFDGEVNKYLDDSRKISFPYSDIPTHTEKRVLCEDKFFTNQIFNYDNLYTVLDSYRCTNYFPFLRTGRGVLVRDSYSTYLSKCCTYSISRDHFLESLNSNKEEDRIVIMNGKAYKDGIVVPGIADVIKQEKEELNKDAESFHNSYDSCFDNMSVLGISDAVATSYMFSKKIDELNNIGEDDLTFDLRVMDDIYLLRIPKDDSGYSIDKIQVFVDNIHKYKIRVTNIVNDQDNNLRINYSSIGTQRSISGFKNIKEPVFDNKNKVYEKTSK